MQENKLVMRGGKLGFCCCPTACQWRVLWTYDCGACSDGAYPSKGYVVGTPEKITADFQTPGDYPNEDNTLVMRYGASPAEACDTPAEGDLDLTTQPSVSPATNPCLVDWVAGAHFWYAPAEADDCDTCLSSMVEDTEHDYFYPLAQGQPDTEAITGCPAAGDPLGDPACYLNPPLYRKYLCNQMRYTGECRKVCP